ncbi:MAG: GNAT family N-acetyltransferase [Anaerolineae bacterium]|nr:GNAT family N-acetyltransferase [Anaerolineae bacterium]
MNEDDWDILFRWNNDPEVLYYSEGDDITSWPMEAMRKLYRGGSQHAYVFMVELEGEPIGECWLQEMNLARVLAAHPGLDVQRIDLMIGEKALWDQGWGTRIIALLTRCAFEVCEADLVYGLFIADYNVRSQRAFERNGYVRVGSIAQPPGSKASVCYDLALTRQAYLARNDVRLDPPK